ncbi:MULTISPECIES: GNAT family N-acetyltransferase [unclassified Pseudomonas]|uniref:GNAT family N-acetyltransferase n=1 Tax=unclassified Pseudomonas TaxID=196821 RepID=UPI002AC99864|nr:MULTISPECIES: GNAT family N-acetyltransferase [unclassified Pseudomonas]MEB0040169.1 GNAT family N-acetyltransferase [Pseudomonas sp. MH10]MEB0122492.1 GNAT family N-acetyltransferase [Pseudomonas sp. CCI1.2]WPX65503.1 GNAT family N-acetyltransferase [Pseudomonas sp. MH10]
MLAHSFDCQPTLRGTTLTLRALNQNDLEGMCGAAGDPEIWASHPAKDRYKREIFEPYFASRLSTETALTIIDTQSGKIVGMSSYYTPPDLPHSIAIGFTFLIRAKWGGAANRELKQLMVEHAFTVFDIVYFHIAPTNIRSQTATMKLGAVHLYDAVLNLSTAPQEGKCYGLTKTQWVQSLTASNARPTS